MSGTVLTKKLTMGAGEGADETTPATEPVSRPGSLPSNEEILIVNVIGRSADLSGDRKVLLGTDQDRKHDGLFIKFVSPEAGETKLRLSYEAMDALVKLYSLHLRDLAQMEATWTAKFNPEGEIVCEHK